MRKQLIHLTTGFERAKKKSNFKMSNNKPFLIAQFFHQYVTMWYFKIYGAPLLFHKFTRHCIPSLLRSVLCKKGLEFPAIYPSKFPTLPPTSNPNFLQLGFIFLIISSMAEIHQIAHLLNETLNSNGEVVHNATEQLDRLSVSSDFPFSLLSLATGISFYLLSTILPASLQSTEFSLLRF